MFQSRRRDAGASEVSNKFTLLLGTTKSDTMGIQGHARIFVIIWLNDSVPIGRIKRVVLARFVLAIIGSLGVVMASVPMVVLWQIASDQFLRLSMLANSCLDSSLTYLVLRS